MKSGLPLSVFSVVSQTEHQTKLDHYPDLIENFEKWRWRKKKDFIQPVNAIWKSENLKISLRPDLAFESAGEKFLGFLNFKKNLDIKKNAAEFLLHVPAEAYEKNGIVGYRYCLINLRDARMWTLGNMQSGLSKQLYREAENFASMYHDIEDAA